MRSEDRKVEKIDQAISLETLEVCPGLELNCERWIEGSWVPASEAEIFTVPALGMEGAVFFSCRDTEAEAEYGVSPLYIVCEHGSGAVIPTLARQGEREKAVRDALKFFLSSPSRTQAWEAMKALAQSRRVNL